jgi:arylsulfatase A-like enzyme
MKPKQIKAKTAQLRSSSGTASHQRLTAILAVLAIATSLGGVRGPSTASAEASSRPNIVLILTDDQRWDSLWAMPAVQGNLVDRGVTFTNGFVVNSLCCPSRASILTGEYSHSTGVYRNGPPPHGGFSAFHDSSTLATWLQGAGYRTALVGKYLNGYKRFTDGSYVPPGWDRWVALNFDGGGIYYNYELSIDGRLRSFGDQPADYSTDVLADYAVSFIRHTTSGPFFLYLAPSAPHGPAIPAPRDAGTFSGLAPWRPPNYNETDVSDKPAWVQARPSLTAGRKGHIDAFRQRQYESLQAVDDAVAAIVRELRRSGRLRDTMIVFTSDNGLLWGEHRLTGKQAPYEESIRVPVVIRYDPLIAASRRDRHHALNIDFAPTFAKLAGVSAPGAEGRSLLPLLSGHATTWRKSFLVEHLGSKMPTFCQVRAHRYAYVQYRTGEEELYDLNIDPYELDNVGRDPVYEHVLGVLRARLVKLCSPPPPGFTPMHQAGRLSGVRLSTAL